MFKLFCELRHDNGTVETVSCSFGSDGWESAFDHLLNVHCRVNTVELSPLYIGIGSGKMFCLTDIFFPNEYAPVDIKDLIED